MCQDRVPLEKCPVVQNQRPSCFGVPVWAPYAKVSGEVLPCCSPAVPGTPRGQASLCRALRSHPDSIYSGRLKGRESTWSVGPCLPELVLASPLVKDSQVPLRLLAYGDFSVIVVIYRTAPRTHGRSPRPHRTYIESGPGLHILSDGKRFGGLLMFS